MYYHHHSEGNFGCLPIVGIFIAYFIFTLVIDGLYNLTTETEWNEGICPKCEVRYELRAAGRYGLKYYACPECGQEVERY